nr:putative ankyrin repeat protein [Quercus suber]
MSLLRRMEDDFDLLISQLPHPFENLFASIDRGEPSRVLDELAIMQARYPERDMDPALLRCVNSGQLAILLLFLGKGYKPGELVMEAAVKGGSQEVLAPLLNAGWHIDRPLRDGVMSSLLCYAVQDESLLLWLIEKGADPNAESNTAETPLSLAVLKGLLTAIYMLLAIGGNVNKGNLLHRAVDRHPSDETGKIIDLLVSKGARVDAIEFEDPGARVLRHVFSRGTALHNACFFENYVAASALLKNGASVFSNRVRNNVPEQYTPLDTARATGNRAMIALLEGNLS